MSSSTRWTKAALVAMASIVAVLTIAFGSGRGIQSANQESAHPSSLTASTADSVERLAAESHVTAQEQVPAAERRTQAGRNVLISFSDGATQTVQLRPLPPVGARVTGPKDRLVNYYADLRRRAEGGEGAAAFRLYQELTRCKRAYGDEQSLKTAIDRLYRERLVAFPDSGIQPIRLRPNADLGEFERQELRRPYEFCLGISDEQKQQASIWLQQGVEAGDHWAMQARAMELGETQEGFEIWDALWRKGNSGALPALSIWYAKGIPESTGGRPDYVSAYAYKLIYFKLTEAAVRNSVSPLRSPMLTSLEDSLGHTGGFLNPAQLEEAVALARVLLENNANCCAGQWR
jgi:hypothetical protein